MALDQPDYSDEYVAGVLKKDAAASSIKYSAVGLQAFLPKRPIGAAPKPNTRFLQNILRETDSHNAALLAREQREAQARQRALNVADSSRHDTKGRPSKRKRTVEEDHDRKRDGRLELYDDEDDQGKSRRPNNHERRRSRSPRGHSRHRRRRSRSVSRSPSPDRKRNRYREDRDDGGREKSSSKYRETEDRRRGERLTRDTDKRPHRSSRLKSYSSARSPSRSRSPDTRHRSHRASRRRNRTRSPDASPPSKVVTSKPVRQISEESDSDPLEAIVGPAPPPSVPRVVKRGRGAFASSSVVDSRFAEGYDPRVDVHPDSDLEDDWDQALEALRDRQKWKSQGAERLRSAGFSETEVKKWEKGGELDESDVKWAKEGEGREWDRGKVVDEDGHVELKPEWGRLKGT